MTLRKFLFWTHLVIGVTFGAVILSTCATGVILSFEPKIVDFVERGIRLVPFPDPTARRLDTEALLARAVESSPKAIPTGFTLSADPRASVQVRMGREGTVYLDPFTGAVLGQESKTHAFMHWAEDWHRRLGNRKIGEAVTGASAIAFLALAVSGVYLWWPRGVTFKKAAAFKWKLKGKARDWNWHTVVGFWLSLYLVMLSGTGIIMSYTWASNLLYTLSGNNPPPPPMERRDAREKPAMPSFKGLNAVVAKAEQQVLGWESLAFRFPPKPDAPMSVFILHDGVGFAGARSQLTLERETAEVVKWEPYAANNAGRKLRIWTTNLHTGRALGWLGHTLNLITALGGLLLIWTGMALSWRRFKNRKLKVA